MQNLGSEDESCPFSFNFEASSFKVGDMVSYRVPDRFDDFPFVGILTEVNHDWVVISPNDPTVPDIRYRATRESRPIVAASEVLPAP